LIPFTKPQTLNNPSVLEVHEEKKNPCIGDCTGTQQLKKNGSNAGDTNITSIKQNRILAEKVQCIVLGLCNGETAAAVWIIQSV
jgi:hypothetical protein